MTSLLSARGVDAGYHGRAVIEDLNLEVNAGEVVALLGPNGAGKTTTLMTLSGAIRPLAGEVLVDGRQTTDPLFRRARLGLAFVTEERSIFAQLSTGDNLRVGRCDREKALDVFPELRPLLRRRAGLLSGGEQQMLSLARAVARRPRMLMVDELSLGLAPLIVTRLLSAVREVADSEHVGVLLVEQHIRQALRVADRIYVMRQGRIILHGTPSEVEGRLEQAYLPVPADLPT